MDDICPIRNLCHLHPKALFQYKLIKITDGESGKPGSPGKLPLKLK